MPRLQVYDAPVCCPAGVHIQMTDPALVQFAADLQWLSAQGISVERYNLAQHPEAFAASEVVKAALSEEGIPCLPLLLVDGSIASLGGYPSRQELAELAGLETGPRPDSDRPRSAFRIVRGKCCG
jgi:hypothetical protein